jgi:hypothetical protein
VDHIKLLVEPPEQLPILDVKETLAVTRELIAERQEKRQIILQEGDFLKDPLGDNLQHNCTI